MIRLPHVLRTRPKLGSKLGVAALLSGAALVATACTTSTTGGSTVTTTAGAPSTSSSTSPGSTAPSTPASSTSSAPPATPVHIKTLNSDGATYGVGMPVIAYFSKKLTSGAALEKATTVTANGKPLTGGWYFETSSAGNGPIEGHWRPENYWPAHSTIHMDIAAKGVSAGKGMAFDDSLTLDFSIGASHILTVDNGTHKLSETFDGKFVGSYPVSLGASNTPTLRGTKVIMEKGKDISMRGPGYYDPHVQWTQRLTYGGEYLHSAPWNTYNIDHGVNSSNGCTNLHPDDAEHLYGQLQVGDVVKYPNANGPMMQLGQGYGDWNLTWSQWQTGGLVSTQS